MFIKLLKISSGDKIIRKLTFRKGINFIVDETAEDVSLELSDIAEKTGNSVGKTTVLKLIDFCLGGNQKQIYSDPENPKQSYEIVKKYLIANKVIITLVLKEDLEVEKSQEIIIERNFLARNKIIRKINGEQITDEQFDNKLKELILPNCNMNRPTFREIISHNIRYKDNSINNTLKTLDRYTSDAEYETLYLFLLGCRFKDGEEKQKIITKINQENTYKDRLEKKQTKTAYEAALSLLDDEINSLNRKKSNLNINENFENDLNQLNTIKYKISRLSGEISNLNIRKKLIEESKEELRNGISNIDLKELRLLYDQASQMISNIQKTFEDLVNYHNKMVIEKMKFIEEDLPELEKKIEFKNSELEDLLLKEKKLAQIISKSDSFEELEKLIAQINEKYRQKGEYEKIISQLDEVEENISNYNSDLKKIDDEIFSDEFADIVKEQINKFNKYFSNVSNNLYGEKYAIKFDIVENRKKQMLYKFSSFNANLSSGKKQGEILCFDIAYCMFADSEEIPCLHFLLNDKKELMHNNQLIKMVNYIEDKNIQVIISMLKDKLPVQLKKEEYYVVNLSQEDKLFKIENSNL